MKKFWKSHLNEIVPYKPGKPIEEVKREFGLERVVKLASNENPLGPSPKVVEAITREASEVNRYPDGGCYYLRKALSGKLSVPEDSFVFGNGSDEVILLALHAFVDPKDEVVVADPTFAIYHIASMVKGAVVRTVPLKDYRYDLDGMLKAINGRTRVVFIANPDNPTGSYVTGEELRSFLDAVPDNVLIFIDEAYYEFAKGGDYPETVHFLEKDRHNIVIARTFSKAYSLAGLRIGYGMAKQEIAEVLNKVREPFNVNSVAQKAAVAALKDEKYMEESVTLVNSQKKLFYDFFKKLDLQYVPSRTNFILVDTGVDSTTVFNSMMKKGVIIRDMAGWGLKSHIRVNIGLEEENNIFFEAFENVIKKMR